ncbi:MAG: alanine:cation symporter family protein [Propionibacteriaceae bacterium]|jgi:AGCS family alanine or glycine:cation symporter|nr:alanine:cation symporter family protein [Propionibacteriaceae bacterium]
MDFSQWLNDKFDAINSFLVNYINDPVYGYLLVFLLVLAGIYFTIRTKFVQFRYFFSGVKTIMEPSPDKEQVSPFQALMVSTASRVGVGNISGVTTAIVSGGPGAVFWMWLIATLGSASAFVESTLAQVYKVKDGSGFRGGPSYYIERALKQRWLGIVFSLALIACYAYGFNALQANNIVGALDRYFPGPIEGETNLTMHIVVGLVLAALVGWTILNGQKMITFVTSVIVPIMAIIYIVLGLAIICLNIPEIPQAFAAIFTAAFDWQAIFGGFLGSAVMYGIKRGLFSNEAGMGSAPNAAAAAHTSHPAKQGLVQMLSVFIDTIIICSTTAFIILCSGVDYNKATNGGLTGMPLVQEAVSMDFGEAGVVIITVSIFLFAFSSIIGNYYYTESNMFFIKGHASSLRIFRTTVVVAVFIGAILSFDLAWSIADFFMAIMTIINIFAILLLGGIAFKVLDDYTRQKKQGLDPVFVAPNIGLMNTDLWKSADWDVDKDGHPDF